MIHVQVTYRIRLERIVEAEQEISAFVESLKRRQPRFEKYHIFRDANDNTSFVHTIVFKDHESQLEHTQSAHVKTFVENMVGFCVVGPIYTELASVTAIGNSVKARETGNV